VYSNEVDDRDAWSELAEQMFPALEILNYGVGGYGVDQAYLKYLAEGTALSPHSVAIGFHPNDLGRLVNVYRRFLSIREFPLVKPRYVLGSNGELALLPTPIRRLSDYRKYLRRPEQIVELRENDEWYESAIYENPMYDLSATDRLVTHLWIRLKRRYFDPNRLFRGGAFNERSTAFKIQIALFEKFGAAVRARGAVPLIVIFPDRDALVARARGRPADYTPLLSQLQARALPYVDLADAFLLSGVPFDVPSWFMPGGHYSPTGNRLVARWLGERLLSRFPRCSAPSIPHATGGGGGRRSDVAVELAGKQPQGRWR